jgi:hypothetical protein
MQQLAQAVKAAAHEIAPLPDQPGGGNLTLPRAPTTLSSDRFGKYRAGGRPVFWPCFCPHPNRGNAP